MYADVAAYVDRHAGASAVAAYEGTYAAYMRHGESLGDALARAEDAVEDAAYVRQSYLAAGGMDRTYGLDALRSAIRRRDRLARALAA